ncbi:MAG: ribosome-binding factor A [Myxococcota bacterium]
MVDADLPLDSLYFSTRSGRRGRSGTSHDTKSLQLCRQVQRRLDLALGELDDPLLQGLWVRAVIPEPGGRSLLVEIVSSGASPVHAILERLDVARGHLRHEIAAAIHRKRTPYLQFMVVPESIEPESTKEVEP